MFILSLAIEKDVMKEEREFVSKPENHKLEKQLQHLFGADARVEGPLGPSGAGQRFTGVDLSPHLKPEQVTFLLNALAWFGIVNLPGQDLSKFGLAHFERFANYWGAPVPHPNNFTRGGKPAQSDGASDGQIEWIRFDDRRVSSVNQVFPDQLKCLSHESPTILVVSNIREPSSDKPVTVDQGGSWHTDIEYELLPIYVSMFLVHKMPVARNSAGNWVEDPFHLSTPYPYLEGSDEELIRLRKRLPLDGGTAFADTAGALAALPESEQRSMEKLQLRRRLNEGDEGWLAPLVRTNPRSGVKSMHSPIWASRPRVRPAVEVDGMSMNESRTLLDQLEAHTLQPEFRYDHLHLSGDVTIWDNYMTLHNSPPMKSNITSIDDARLLYRLSCKGEPALTLPRNDPPRWLEAHITGNYTTPPEILEVS